MKDFEITAGDSKYLLVTVEDDTLDLTSSQIKWGFSNVIKSVGSGITVTGNNTFQVAIEPEDTENLTGAYVHEAEVTDPLGNVSTVLNGVMTIKRSIV